MSLTNDNHELACALDVLFKKIMNISQANDQNLSIVIPLRPDKSKTTYFTPRKKKTMEKSDFEVHSSKEPNELEQSVKNLWKDFEAIGFLDLIPDLTSLASLLKTVEEQSEEVSPFIYVMF